MAAEGPDHPVQGVIGPPLESAVRPDRLHQTIQLVVLVERQRRPVEEILDGIAIGVARGKGRFRSYYHAGQGPDSDFYSASVPTTANPIYATMAAAEGISATAYLRKHFDPDLTDKEFARQYLAQWIEEDGTVFSDYERYFTGQGLLATGPHIMSLDLGKLHDFTVAYVGDVARQEFVARLRFNKIDYMDQVPQIAALYHKYGCRFIHMDVNGVGEAPAEMLRREHGCAVIPFKWTNESKQALISVMVLEVQRGNIKFMADDDVLKKEMALFEGVVSPGGTLRYDAPKGFYDDCVISAALLIQKMARNYGANPPYWNKEIQVYTGESGIQNGNE